MSQTEARRTSSFDAIEVRLLELQREFHELAEENFRLKRNVLIAGAVISTAAAVGVAVGLYHPEHPIVSSVVALPGIVIAFGFAKFAFRARRQEVEQMGKAIQVRDTLEARKVWAVKDLAA